MKICFISPYSPKTVTGIGSFLLNLSKYLESAGHEPIIITKYECSDIDITNMFDSNNFIEVKHTKVNNLANIHFTFATLKTIYKMRNRIDILHLQQTYMLSAFSSVLGKLLDIPVVTTAHLKVVEPENQIKKWMNSFFISVTMRFSDEIIYVSEETKQSFGSPKGFAIRNGIDTEKYIQNKRKRIELRQKHNLQSQFVLLFASRWVPDKGIFRLLTSFKDIKETYGKDIKLVLIGSGDKDQVLKEIEILDIADGVLPIGTVNDVYDYYCMADLFILPSLFEGLPMALLEAMSCSLPCIASKVGGNPELITSGDNGYLIEPGDPEELTEAIEWCLDNRQNLESVGKNAAQTVRERFSMEAVANKYIKAYTEL